MIPYVRHASFLVLGIDAFSAPHPILCTDVGLSFESSVKVIGRIPPSVILLPGDEPEEVRFLQ